MFWTGRFRFGRLGFTGPDRPGLDRKRSA